MLRKGHSEAGAHRQGSASSSARMRRGRLDVATARPPPHTRCMPNMGGENCSRRVRWTRSPYPRPGMRCHARHTLRIAPTHAGRPQRSPPPSGCQTLAARHSVRQVPHAARSERSAGHRPYHRRGKQRHRTDPRAPVAREARTSPGGANFAAPYSTAPPSGYRKARKTSGGRPPRAATAKKGGTVLPSRSRGMRRAVTSCPALQESEGLPSGLKPPPSPGPIHAADGCASKVSVIFRVHAEGSACAGTAAIRSGQASITLPSNWIQPSYAPAIWGV
eukprot:scaffold759_cov119-Isochrysis_galbana.AAC.6